MAGRGQYIDRQKAVDMSKTGILCVDIGLNFNCSMMVVPRAGVIAILKQGPVESLSLFGTGRVLNATRTLAGILASPDHDTTTPRHHDTTTPRRHDTTNTTRAAMYEHTDITARTTRSDGTNCRRSLRAPLESPNPKKPAPLNP